MLPAGVLLVAGCRGERLLPVEPAAATPGTAALAFQQAASSGASAIAVSFESFSPGGIHGQQDWKSLGGAGAPPPTNPADTHCAVYDHVIQDNALLASAPIAFATRSLRMSNAVTSGCYTDQTFSARVLDPAGQAGASSRSPDGTVEFSLPGGTLRNHFDATWTVASADPGAHQPGLEVVVSPARGDSHRMTWVRMADLADGLAITFAERADPANPGAFQLATVATGLSRSIPHTIRISATFANGPDNDVVRVYVDGVLRHTGRSWENFYLREPNGAANFGGNPPAVNRLMFRTGSDLLRGVPGDPAPALAGRGYLFDAVEVSTWSVPIAADDCKNDRWRTLRSESGAAFRNQGDCVTAAK